MNCVGCKKKLEKGEFVVLNGGALVKTKTGATMGDKNLIGFLTVSAHFDSKEDYRSCIIANDAPNGQFEFYACSYICLAEFLTRSIFHLKKLSEIKKVEIAPATKIDPKWAPKVLKLLGHPEALVSDESTVGDFLFAFDKKIRVKQLEKLNKKFGFEVRAADPIWKLIEKFKRNQKNANSN